VKALNNTIFDVLLKRTVLHAPNKIVNDESKLRYSVEWAWDYRKDKKRFIQYYNLFATKEDAIPSPPAIELYRMFKEWGKSTRSRK